MAAKKKRRGLSGSPEEHKRRVAGNIQAGESYFAQGIAAAKAGQCSNALMFYGMGAGRYDTASNNAHDAKMPDDTVDELRKYYKKAATAMESHCLVGGGLSGMKRRSRR